MLQLHSSRSVARRSGRFGVHTYVLRYWTQRDWMSPTSRPDVVVWHVLWDPVAMRKERSVADSCPAPTFPKTAPGANLHPSFIPSHITEPLTHSHHDPPTTWPDATHTVRIQPARYMQYDVLCKVQSLRATAQSNPPKETRCLAS